jgi:hypothetical protein
VGESRPRVLIAGPAEVCCKGLLLALEDDVQILPCETLDQAVERIRREDPHFIVVCTLFDEMRPFRLIHHVRSELDKPDLPIMLVQIVEAHLGSTLVKQMSDAYGSIGANGFIDLREEAEAYGAERALQRFRASVISRLQLQP